MHTGNELLILHKIKLNILKTLNNIDDQNVTSIAQTGIEATF